MDETKTSAKSPKKAPRSDEAALEVVSPENRPNVSIEAIIQSAITNGVPVETMERLLAMRRELKQEAAKEAFDSAMAKFQADCPTIEKTKEVKNNSVVVYRYAPIESIVAQVKRPLQANGFSYKTDQELKETGVKVIVTVIHEQGHSEQTSMEVPFGTKTGIMSQTQVTAAATTFAKRYAFCNAFGILTGDEDTDAVPQPQEPRRMAPYEVRRVEYPKMDETNDTHGLKEADEPKEDSPAEQKQIIKHLLEQLGESPMPSSVKRLTGIAMKEGTKDLPENYLKIIAKLEALLDA